MYYDIYTHDFDYNIDCCRGQAKVIFDPSTHRKQYPRLYAERQKWQQTFDKDNSDSSITMFVLLQYNY